jgi:hypothetical protein
MNAHTPTGLADGRVKVAVVVVVVVAAVCWLASSIVARVMLWYTRTTNKYEQALEVQGDQPAY